MRGNVSGRRNQMAGWFVQSLAICANENLPKSKKLYQSKLKRLPKSKKLYQSKLKRLPKSKKLYQSKLKRLPNTSCQSGEIGQTQLH